MSGFGLMLGGQNGYDGAKTDRLMRDMPTSDLDPRDVYAADGPILLARSTHMARNNPYAKAMINAMQGGVVGPQGLLFKSLYKADPDADGITEEDRRFRRQITRLIRKACAHIDAAGLLSYRQWEDSLVFGKAVHGEAIKTRVFLPRAQATHATAWRCVHPSRVCNPNYGPDSDRLQQGVALDEHGAPVGLWVISRHPNRLLAGTPHWRYIPLLDENGLEQVIWHSARIEPEQLRAPGWFAPVMTLLIHLGNVTAAHVVAKRLQACLGLIIEVDDPVAAARRDRNGETLTRNTIIQPGKTYYVKRGNNVRPFDFKYEGADYEAFTDALLKIVCAAFGPGIPSQFAMQQLTKGNMASSRAAIMQAWRSFRREQVDHEAELRIVVKNYLAESIALGQLQLPTGADLDAACAGYFVPPQRLSTDEHREMQGAELKRKVIGVSRTTLAREYGGYDLDDERDQNAEDEAIDGARGIAATDPTDDELEPIPEAPVDDPDDDDEPDAAQEAA